MSVSVVQEADRASRGAPTPTAPVLPAPLVTTSPGAAASVTLSKGVSAIGRPGCTASACAYLQVSINGLGGGLHTIACHDDGGAWFTYTTSSLRTSNCYYGFSGKTVWVTVDGVLVSNRVVW